MLMRDEMKRTRRSKQVTAKSSKSPIPANRIRDEDDDEAWPSQPSESLAVTVVNPKKSKSQLQTKPGSIPDNPPEEMTILPFTFFQIDALDLAPRLLGKFLRRDDVVLQITEVILTPLSLFFSFFFSVSFSRKCSKREETAVSKYLGFYYLSLIRFLSLCMIWGKKGNKLEFWNTFVLWKNRLFVRTQNDLHFVKIECTNSICFRP